jgi:hypothetical protein
MGREPFWIQNSRCNYADASTGVLVTIQDRLLSISCGFGILLWTGFWKCPREWLTSGFPLLPSGSRNLMDTPQLLRSPSHTSRLLTRAHPRSPYLSSPDLTSLTIARDTLSRDAAPRGDPQRCAARGAATHAATREGLAQVRVDLARLGFQKTFLRTWTS